MGSAKIGNLSLGKSFWGSKEVNAIYYGTTKIYEKTQAEQEIIDLEDRIPYLRFYNTSSFGIEFNNFANSFSGEGTLEYSTNNSTWTTWDGSEISAVNDGTYYNVYLRGSGNTKIGGGGIYGLIVKDNAIIEGNPESLLDYQSVSNGYSPTATNGLKQLFYKDAEYKGTPYNQITLGDIKFSRKNVPSSFYYGMFQRCILSSGTATLKAETIASNSLGNMFWYSSASLETSPGQNMILVNLPYLTEIPSLFYGGDACGASGYRFTNALQTIASESLKPSQKYYFDIPANEAVNFDLTAGFRAGTSKTSNVYNIYTDNLAIKDQVDNFGGQYTTINIYKYDGSSW